MTAKKGVEPTPILNALHSMQNKEGILTRASLEKIAKTHNMAIADILMLLRFIIISSLMVILMVIVTNDQRYVRDQFVLYQA